MEEKSKGREKKIEKKRAKGKIGKKNKKQYKFNVQFGWSLTEKGKLEQIQS